MAVASLDLNGLILDVNDALLTASGYSKEELAGRPFTAFMDLTGEPAAREHFAALAAGRVDSYRVERKFVTKSGHVRDVDLSVSLVRDAAGRPEVSLAVLQDVTAHKRATEEAARRAAELEAIIRSLPAGIYIGDEQGITMANQIALDQLGFQSNDELQRHVSEIPARLASRDANTGVPVAWDDAPFVRALGGEHVERELIPTHVKRGEDVVLRVVAAPVRLGDRTIGAVAISTDITDRKRTEEALKLSEARYRAIMEQSPFSVQILSPDGRTLQVNAAWERLWGVTLEQIAGYNMLEDQQLVEGGLMPGIRRGFGGEATELPATLYDPNVTIPDVSNRPDPRRWVRAVIYPVKDARGQVREVVLIHEDISEKLRAEELRRRIESDREQLLIEARRAHQEAEAASRVKDEFLATLSHELRTPLNAVIGWTRILKGAEPDQRLAHGLEVIERNAWAQARMVDDLLDVSRIITGNIRLQVEPVDIAEVALPALDSIRPAADAKGVRLVTRIAEGLPKLAADPARLQQVFWNLLSNAVKFTDGGGEIVISVERDPRGIAVVVSDTGIGITAAAMPYLFDRFTQGDSSSTRRHAGLGLGLAIVRHLVELHGGSVSAASEGPGRGATFRVLLPVG